MIFRELCKIREKSSTTKEDMIIPKGYVFRPTDEELLIHYLVRKCKHLSLPCNVVFECQIYGVWDKAPWQIFTKDDPWTEHTIYVFTRLIKASKNSDWAARTADCGTWHGETGLENVRDDEGGVIGSKRTLCFRINNESGVIDEEGERKGHWIMHEYSLGDGKSPAGKGEYVLCRIRRLDKDPKKSVRKAKNVDAGSVDDHVAVPKPAKRARTEFVPEQKMDCDIAAEPETEVVSLSEDLFVQESGFMTGKVVKNL